MREPDRSSCPLRLMIVGRRFWPHGGHDSACHLTNLATGLHRQGLHVEVVSPRFSNTWPDQFDFRGLRVHRPVPAPKSDWSISRYTRQLTQWLRSHCRSFDVILVDSIREEAVAAIEATRGTACRTILRLGSQDALDDSQWWQRSRGARRCAAIGRMADRVIVKNADQARTLLTHQFDAARLARIEVGVGTGHTQTAQAKGESRRALALVNSDLLTDEDTVVLLCHSRMIPNGGIESLVDSARLLITKYSNMRIWFIGDGPSRDKIYSSLRGDGIRAHIAMPGSFCSMDDLMMAADLYVQAGTDGTDYFLPSAVAAGLPIVAREASENHSFFTETPLPSQPSQPCHEVHWFDGTKEQNLRKRIHHVLKHRTTSLESSAVLKRRMQQSRPESRMLEAYEDLIRHVGIRKFSEKSHSKVAK